MINYSFPLSVEDYVHRIGRTGRGGASGISHTFFTDFDKGLAGALVAVCMYVYGVCTIQLLFSDYLECMAGVARGQPRSSKGDLQVSSHHQEEAVQGT